MKKFYTYDPNTFRYNAIVEVNDALDNWTRFIPDYSTVMIPGEITDDSFESYYNTAANVWLNRKVEPSLTDELETARKYKIKQLFSEYQAQFDAVNAVYPLEEREGWYIQLEEAKAFLESGDIAQAPTLALMVQLRGRNESLEEFANSIIRNNVTFRQLYGAITSQQQKMHADIMSLDTVEQIIQYPIQWMKF